MPLVSQQHNVTVYKSFKFQSMFFVNEVKIMKNSWNTNSKIYLKT